MYQPFWPSHEEADVQPWRSTVNLDQVDTIVIILLIVEGYA